MTAKVSVIIPVHNRATTIGRALISLQNQSTPDWLALVVDDGSTDNSLAVAKEFANHDNRITVTSQPNAGAALARNAGITAASTPYITFLDSDDEYLPNHLEIRLNFFSQNPGVDMIEGGFKVIGDIWVADRHDQSKQVDVRDCVITGGIFGKRDIFMTLEGFRNLPYAEDSDLIERAQKMCSVMHFSEQTYIYHREDTNSISHAVLRS